MGSIDVSSVEQNLPSIVAKKGEVVLDVKAAAVNFPDILIVQGKYQFKVQKETPVSTTLCACARSCASMHADARADACACTRTRNYQKLT